MGLDVGLRNGLSADEMTRDLRQYLLHPDKLFRRVRDEHGLLKLSQAAKDFHPGRGVYRSSYMNARRLAATETNIAYRTADHLRWQKMDFVVGIEIVLSNNHTIRLQPGEKTSDLPGQMRADGTPKANAVRTLTDICDTLAGRYSKDFKFTGWHPHCRCRAVTILKTEEEMARDTQRILDGRQPSTDSDNAVTDTPEAFKGWVENNRDRIANGHSLPYFIRDNAKYTGITTKQTRTAKTPLDIAAERHANRTIAQVRDIQFRWSRRLANRINFDAINVSDRGRYGRLIVMTSIAEKKEFNAAEFNLLYGIVVRHAQRTAKQIQEIRQRWDKRIIERAGETKQVAALRKVLEQQKITDISDVKRVMHAFYGQFPQEFNNVRVDFVSFDRPPLNGYFPIQWQKIHNSLHSKSPYERLPQKLRDKLSIAEQRGAKAEIVNSDSKELQQAVKLMRHCRCGGLHNKYSCRHYFRLKPRRTVRNSKLFEHLATSKQCKIFATKYKNRVIGTCVCFFFGGNAYMWQLASLRKSFMMLYPASYTVWSALKYAHEQGFAHMYFLDAGLPFKRNPMREFILNFGGKQVAEYRWFRIQIPWIGKFMDWFYNE